MFCGALCLFKIFQFFSQCVLCMYLCTKVDYAYESNGHLFCYLWHDIKLHGNNRSVHGPNNNSNDATNAEIENTTTKERTNTRLKRSRCWSAQLIFEWIHTYTTLAHVPNGYTYMVYRCACVPPLCFPAAMENLCSVKVLFEISFKYWTFSLLVDL